MLNIYINGFSIYRSRIKLYFASTYKHLTTNYLTDIYK